MVQEFSYRLLVGELRAPAKACGIVLGKAALYRLILCWVKRHCTG